MLAIVPGDDRVLEIGGTAHVSTDPAIVEAMAVRGREPKVAVAVDVQRVELRHEPAITAAGLWDPAHHVAPTELPRAAQIWTDHVKANDEPSTEARALRELLDADVLAAGLEQDYEHDLS